MSSVHGYTSTQEQWSPDAETSADVRRTLVHLCIQTLLPHDGTRGQWPRRAPTSVHQWSPMLMSRRHLVTLYYRVYVFPSNINYLEVLPFLYRARVFETMMSSIDDEESVLYNVLPPCHPDV